MGFEPTTPTLARRKLQRPASRMQFTRVHWNAQGYEVWGGSAVVWDGGLTCTRVNGDEPEWRQETVTAR